MSKKLLQVGVATILSLLLMGVVASAGEVPTLALTRADQAPVIDGKLSDACWQKAAWASNFWRFDKEERAQAQTEVLVCYDDQALYLGWKCMEPDTSKLVGTVKEHDGPVHLNDCVELFIAPGTDEGAYYHFIVSVANTRGEKWHRGGARFWDGDWSSATQVGKGAWTVEMAIPWYNFAENLALGPWRINLGREKWTEPKEISSWAYTPKKFHRPERFGKMATPEVDLSHLQALRMYSLSIGTYGLDETGYSYTVKGLLMNKGREPRKMLLEGEDQPRTGKTARTKVLTDLPARKIVPFELSLGGLESLGLRRVALRLRHPETGQAYYVMNLGEKSFPRMMTGCFDRNYYTKEKTGAAIVSLNMPEGTKQEFLAQLELLVKGKQGEKVIRKQTKVTDPRNIGIRFDLREIPLGVHQAVVRVRDARNNLIAEKVLKLRKPPPAPTGLHEVKVDRMRMALLVDGKPFFPIGIYGIVPEYMKEVADAGFNCTIRWSPAEMGGYKYLKELMETSEEAGRQAILAYPDACQKAGLFMIDWPFFLSYEKLRYASIDFSERFARFLNDQLPFIVETVREHPALLAYYGPDEPSEQHRGQCLQAAEIFWELDPYHPHFMLFCGGVLDWPEVYDVAGMDLYPGFGRKSLFPVFTGARRGALVAEANRVPYWHVPLLCGRGSGNRCTGPEQRAQAYLAVIGGAKGILWFVWPPRHQSNWGELRKIAREFTELTPVLTEASPEQDIRRDPPEMTETLQVLVKEHKGKTYLIMANADPEPLEASFALPEKYSGKCQVLFENRKLNLVNAKFTDHFAGFASHVYELSRSWPSGGVLTVSMKSEAKEEVAKEEITAPNLISNPGFEIHGDWGFDAGDPEQGTVTGKFEEADAHAGKRCAVIHRPHAHGQARFTGKGVLLQPGTKYIFGAYGRAVGGSASLYLESRDPAGADLKQATTIRFRDRSPGWDYYFVSFETKDKEVLAQPVCVFEGGEGNAWFDDVFLRIAGRAESRNLIRNSGFEREREGQPGWPENWSPGETILAPGFIGVGDASWGTDTSVAFEGNKSLRMRRTSLPRPDDRRVQGRNPGAIYVPPRDDVLDVTKHYTCSLYMKADRPDLPVYFIGGAHNTANFKVSTEWQRYTLTVYEKPGIQRYFMFNVMLEEVGTLWIDAVQREEGKEVTPYVAGM